MPSSVMLRFPRGLDVALQLTAQTAGTLAGAWLWGIVVWLMMVISPWQVMAETATPTPSPLPERASALPRHGTVTQTSNLRASPSPLSEVVGVAKEKARVKILQESGRWYQVSSEDGVDAWIHKSLVLIDQEATPSPSATAGDLGQSDLVGITSAPAPDVVDEFHAEDTAEEVRAVAVSAAPVDWPYGYFDTAWTNRLVDVLLAHIHGPAAYVISALALTLLLSITLQLRAGRQLRRAMREMGQILDMVEEIYAGGLLARLGDSDTAFRPLTAPAPAQPTASQGLDFSPIEYAVLEALSDQQEVQETELGKMLTEKGFAGVLMKAVITDILRKTSAVGLPWVEVRYVQGRFRYRLRQKSAPNIDAARLQKP
jgi:Bacterial SH3 domain